MNMAMRPVHPEGLALRGADGEERGFVDPEIVERRVVLQDLWVMQGSLCDLRCKHCYTASSPTADHLEQVTFVELAPHLEEAARFGVTKIWFTGGEVFVNHDVLRRRAERNDEFLKSLALALEIAPVEILTNGRRYIRSHIDALERLCDGRRNRLTLRITLESPSAPEHDAIRGRGTFDQTVASVHQLLAAGFRIVLTAERPLLDGLTDDQIRDSYRALFEGATVEVNLIDNMLEMGQELVRIAGAGRGPRPDVFVTRNCFTLLSKPPESLMCHFSRCIQKVAGKLRYYPCPVIYNDPRFELGATLEESLRRVYVAHKNCYDYCMRGRGATCRTRPI